MKCFDHSSKTHVYLYRACAAVFFDKVTLLQLEQTYGTSKDAEQFIQELIKGLGPNCFWSISIRDVGFQILALSYTKNLTIAINADYNSLRPSDPQPATVCLQQARVALRILKHRMCPRLGCIKCFVKLVKTLHKDNVDHRPLKCLGGYEVPK